MCSASLVGSFVLLYEQVNIKTRDDRNFLRTRFVLLFKGLGGLGFAQRLKEAIGSASVNSFAKKSGLSEGILRQYLSGISQPGLDKLIAISETAGVSLLWLATGKGSMHDETPPPDEILGVKATPIERAAVELFRALSPKDQAELLAKMAMMSESASDLKKSAQNKGSS